MHCPAARQSADASAALAACRLSSLLLGGYCEDVRAYAQQDADEDNVYAEVALGAHLHSAHSGQRQASVEVLQFNAYALDSLRTWHWTICTADVHGTLRQPAGCSWKRSMYGVSCVGSMHMP
jgi:hypothetical protein